MLSRLSGRARELADQAMVELRDALEDEAEESEGESPTAQSPSSRVGPSTQEPAICDKGAVWLTPL